MIWNESVKSSKLPSHIFDLLLSWDAPYLLGSKSCPDFAGETTAESRNSGIFIGKRKNDGPNPVSGTFGCVETARKGLRRRNVVARDGFSPNDITF